jgi:hypothetical protein
MEVTQTDSRLALALRGSRRLNEMQDEICQALKMIRTESSPEIIRPGGAWTNGLHTCTVQLIDGNEDCGRLRVKWFNALPFFMAEVSSGSGSTAFVHSLMSGERYNPIKAKYVPLIWKAMEEVVANAELHLYGMREKLEFYRSVVAE